jgi:hypothetical protein
MAAQVENGVADLKCTCMHLAPADGHGHGDAADG